MAALQGFEQLEQRANAESICAGGNAVARLGEGGGEGDDGEGGDQRRRHGAIMPAALAGLKPAKCQPPPLANPPC